MLKLNHRILSAALVLVLIFTLCSCAAGTEEAKVSSETVIISESELVTETDVTETDEIAEEPKFDWYASILPDKELEPQDFIHTEGKLLIDENGEQYLMRGANFCNDALLNPPVKPWDPMEERYSDLAACGLNSVRFLINYGLFENDDDPYNYKESGFEWLDKNIACARKYGIKLLFNMHLPVQGWPSHGCAMPLYSSANTEYQDRFVKLWTAIAERYRNIPDVIGYDLNNEAVLLVETTQEDAYNRYNALMQRTIDSIRTVDKNHIIVVDAALGMALSNGGDGGNYNNGFPVLSDSNLVLEYHNYDPVDFTCQDGESDEPGKVYKSSMKKEHKEALLGSAKIIWKQNVPAFCGEVGCTWATLERSPSAADWVSDCVDIFEENNISYAFFAFWDEYYEPTGLKYSFWHDNMLDILKNKLGDPNAETYGVFTKGDFPVPLNAYAFADYMKASGVNCVVNAYYYDNTHGYCYPNEPVCGWTGNDTWHTEIDMRSWGLSNSTKIGSFNAEVVTYGMMPEAFDVTLLLDVYLYDRDGNKPKIQLSNYPRECSVVMNLDAEFNQNVCSIELSEINEVAETIGDIRDYWLVIDAKMLEYSDYFSIPQQ